MDDIRRLSIPERILLVEDIWDTIAMSADQVPLTDRQRQELDRRLDKYLKDASAGKASKDPGHEG